MNPPGPQETYPKYAEPRASGAGAEPVTHAVSPGSARDRSPEADSLLPGRMREGDERALGELYDGWASRVYALALAMLRDASEAEDVTEETFWQAWRQAARYDGARGTVSSWLLTIARSRALDRLRARRRRPEEPLGDDAANAIESAGTGADVAVDLGDRARAVRAAVQLLPAEQREALQLAYFGGLSQTEIAERTGQPLGTVKTRMRLGVAKLRESLASLGGGRP